MMKSNEVYDAIVIGSGAGGGMCAYNLTHRGIKVMMLEAGRNYDPISETPMFSLPTAAPLRGAPTPDRPFGFYDALVGGFRLPDEPYTVADGSHFNWLRARMLGGRTNHWHRTSLRYGPYDFKPYSRDGLGADWPISYEEIAPWYDKVERLIGVTGKSHGIENNPDSPPGVALPPPPPSPREYFLKLGLERLGYPVSAVRAAILTKPLNGRPACIYATPCNRGCSIGANFQSTTVLIPPALKTGNLTIRTQALAYKIGLNSKGRATSVSYVDRITGQHYKVSGRAVVLAASSCESARLLLNSRNSSFPNGLANENGLVGRNLMDSPYIGVTGQFPALERLPPRNEDGMSVSHIYVPWWGHARQARGEWNFPRGYHIEFVGGCRVPEMDYATLCNSSHGPDLKHEIRQRFGSDFTFYGQGEMIPNEHCYCELDTKVKDRWGIPVLRFHWRWSEHELRQVNHMNETFYNMIEKLGGRVIPGPKKEQLISNGGEGCHEVGVTRMGSTAKESVVNRFGQSWGVKNLFVMDGGVMVSSPDKNPTLSILALSYRSSGYLADEARKGNL